MASVIRRRYLGGAAAALGGLLAAACGEIEVRYVQGPAGPAGPAGAQGERGATGAAGAKGAAGAAGQTQTIVQEKVVTVEKPVIVEKVVTVDRPVVVEKTVEVPGKTIVPKKVFIWTNYYKPGRAMNEMAQALQRLSTQWNEEHNDIIFLLQPIGGQGYVTEKIVSSYAAGVHPHLQQGNYWNSTIYGVNGMSPNLHELFVSKDKEFADSIEDYFPHVQETMYWRDQLWSIPFNLDADLPYTNLNHVRAAGLQPLKIGYTWDDLVEYGKTLQTTHGAGRETNIWAFAHFDNWVNFLNLLKQAGGDLYNEDMTKVVLNSSEGVEALQFLSDLVHKHQVHRPHDEWFEANGKDRPSFTNGQVTMFYETSHVRIIAHGEAIGGLENFYISPPPSKKQPFIGTFGTGVHMLKKNSDEMEAAWQVLRWLTSTGPAAVWCSAALFVPARKSILTHPLWVERMEQVPQYLPFLEAVNYGFRPYHPVFFPEHYSVLRGILGDVTKTPNVAFKTNLDEAARQMNVLLDSFNSTGKISKVRP